MNPWKVSAEYAAFVWFTSRKENASAEPGAARQYARDNWVAFLPCAQEGVGRLLIKIASPKTRRKTSSKAETRTLAGTIS